VGKEEGERGPHFTRHLPKRGKQKVINMGSRKELGEGKVKLVRPDKKGDLGMEKTQYSEPQR